MVERASPYATVEDLRDMERRLVGVGSELDRLRGWRRSLEEDDAFGRILSGPQWIDGISVMGGAIEGSHFAAEVTVSSLFKTDESPNARWELDNSSLRFYDGTNTLIFKADPSAAELQFGAGASNTITFSGGVLSVPKASIGALTIADIGSGNMGGTYRTANSGVFPRMDISTAGIQAYESGGSQTFDLDASNGNFQMVGTFTIASSTVASNRLELNTQSIELWKSGTREFLLQGSGSTNAIEMLLTGPGASDYIGMNPTTGLWLGASSFASAPFRVDPDGSMTAVGASIQSASGNPRVVLSASGLIAYNAGGSQTVNISGASSTITAGLFRTSSSNPRVEMDSTGIYQYSSGGVQIAAIKTNGTGWLGASSNQISWSGSTVSVNGQRIDSGTVDTAQLSSLAVTDAKISSVSAGKLTTGSITSTTITIGSGGKLQWEGGSSYIDSSGIVLATSGVFGDAITWKVSGVSRGSIFALSSYFIFRGTGSATLQVSSNTWYLDNGGGDSLRMDPSGRTIATGEFFPGNQTAKYVGYNNTYASLILGGPVEFRNNYSYSSPSSSWSSGTPAADGAGYITVYVYEASGPVLRRIPTYTNA